VVAENKRRYHARHCGAQGAAAELDEAEVGNIEKHMRKIERAVSKGDKALARARFLKLVTLEQDADAEFGLLERAARENEAGTCEGEVEMVNSSAHLNPTTSVMIDVGEGGKADLNSKSQGDTAGTGWVRATKEEIRAHIIAQPPDCMADGKGIPDRFIDAYHRASQPPTEHLPAGNHQPLSICVYQAQAWCSELQGMLS
jgi:hypothetical protein